MGVRRKGRIIAFQTLYRYDLTKAPLEELLDFSWIDPQKVKSNKEEIFTFARLIIQGTIENIEKIDSVIQNQLEHWDIARLSKVDLAIIRISTYALLFEKDIPPSVTIDEAIDIAKEFGSEDSYRFINGVLDGIRKKYVK